MELYGHVNDTREARSMKKWIENYICGAPANDKQGVVGRRDCASGGKVTAHMVATKARDAHVCPFVRDSLEKNLFWIEECDLGHDQLVHMAVLLLSQIDKFKNTHPVYDPAFHGKPAPESHMLKTFLLYFPRYEHPSGLAPGIDTVHQLIKPVFLQHGLMIGQFYKGCRVPGIWDGRFHPLTSPYPAFAIRYMLKHDHHFLAEEDYRRYFLATPEREHLVGPDSMVIGIK